MLTNFQFGPSILRYGWIVVSLFLATSALKAQTSPSITDARSSQNFLESDVKTTPQLLFPAGTISFNSGLATYSSLIIRYVNSSNTVLTMGLSEDILYVRNQGTGAGEVNVILGNPNTVRVGTKTVGTFPSSLTGSGVNGEFLQIFFNSNADLDDVRAVINNFNYQNTSSTPTWERRIRLTVTNTNGTATKYLNITVTPTNTAPNMGASAGGYGNVLSSSDAIQGWPQPYASGTGSCGSCSPASEMVANAIDGLISTKYLNFAAAGTGFVVTPISGPTIVTQLTFTSANDESGRDPMTYTLEGSRDGGGTWTTIIANANTGLTTTRFHKVTAAAFTNTEWYSTYRLTFPTLRGATMMQIAEVEFLGEPFQREVFTVGESGAIQVYPSLPVTDPDSDSLQSAEVVIASNFSQGHDVLAWTPMAGISGSYDANTGILTFTGPNTLDNYRTLLRSVTFNTTGNLFKKERLITFKVTDHEGPQSLTSNEAEARIVVTFRPTLTGMEKVVTAIRHVARKIAYEDFAGSALGFGDADAEDHPLSFMVKSVGSNGTLRKNGVNVVAGMVIELGDTFIWTPSSNGTNVTICTVRAFDGDMESTTNVLARGDVGSQVNWNGNTSTAWGVGSNWSTGTVPGTSHTVNIPNSAPRFPTISSTRTIGNLIVGSSAMVNIPVGTSLTVEGNVENNGHIIMRASALGYGQLIYNTATGNGTATREMYLAGAGVGQDEARWFSFGSPFRCEFNELHDGTSRFNLASQNRSPLWEWDAEAGTYILPQGSEFEPGKGYFLYAGRNAKNEVYTTTLPTTVSLTGKLEPNNNFGSELKHGVAQQHITIEGAHNDGWNFMANPYLSAYDFGANGTNPHPFDADVVGTISVFNNGPLGARYTTYTPASSSGTARRIAPMQGFWIRTTADEKRFDFSRTRRVGTHIPSILRSTQNQGHAQFVVGIAKTDNPLMEDDTWINFMPSATETFDNHLDAHKLHNGGELPNLYTRHLSEVYAVNSLPVPSGRFELPLVVKSDVGGTYAIDLREMTQPHTVILKDLFEDVLVDLTATAYTFNYSPADDPDRFVLIFEEAAGKTVSVKELADGQSLHAWLSGDDLLLKAEGLKGPADLKLYDLGGRLVWAQTTTLEEGITRIPAQSLASGVYMLHLGGEFGQQQIKVMK